MILEVDMGNSSLKWRLRKGEQTAASGSVLNQDIIHYNQVFDRLPCRPDKMLVSSVVPSENGDLASWAMHRWQLKPSFAQVSQFCAGVTNAYQDVSQMGVDRWLAMLTAFNLYRKACLVVDAGSACTVDLLTGSGVHLGGYIAPGIELMRESLFRDTDRVKLNVIDYDKTLTPGVSTHAAVSSALHIMQLGLVKHALNELLSEGCSPIVIITGGGAQALCKQIEPYAVEHDCLIELNPSLVLDGLRLAIPD